MMNVSKGRFDMLTDLARGLMFMVLNPNVKQKNISLIGTGSKYSREQTRKNFELFKESGFLIEQDHYDFIDGSEEYSISEKGKDQLAQWRAELKL